MRRAPAATDIYAVAAPPLASADATVVPSISTFTDVIVELSAAFTNRILVPELLLPEPHPTKNTVIAARTAENKKKWENFETRCMLTPKTNWIPESGQMR